MACATIPGAPAAQSAAFPFTKEGLTNGKTPSIISAGVDKGRPGDIASD